MRAEDNKDTKLERESTEEEDKTEEFAQDKVALSVPKKRRGFAKKNLSNPISVFSFLILLLSVCPSTCFDLRMDDDDGAVSIGDVLAVSGTFGSRSGSSALGRLRGSGSSAYESSSSSGSNRRNAEKNPFFDLVSSSELEELMQGDSPFGAEELAAAEA